MWLFTITGTGTAVVTANLLFHNRGGDGGGGMKTDATISVMTAREVPGARPGRSMSIGLLAVAQADEYHR